MLPPGFSRKVLPSSEVRTSIFLVPLYDVITLGSHFVFFDLRPPINVNGPLIGLTTARFAFGSTVA